MPDDIDKNGEAVKLQQVVLEDNRSEIDELR